MSAPSAGSGTAEFAPSITRGRRYELDWLRALIVLGLIPFHAAVIFGATTAVGLKTNQALRYLNEATFPVYLLHMTVLTVVAYYVVQWPLFWGLRMAIIIAVTLIATFAVYEVAIRRLPLARVLCGMKPMPPSGRWHSRWMWVHDQPAATSVPEGDPSAIAQASDQQEARQAGALSDMKRATR